MREFLESTEFIALVGALFGGTGIKILQHLFSRTRTKVEQERALRDELRADITRLRSELANSNGEIARLTQLLDDSRKDYYGIRETLVEMMASKERLDILQEFKDVILSKKQDESD